MSQRSLTRTTGRSPGDHVCWPFQGVEEYVDDAREYVAEGLDRHELVTYVRGSRGGLQHTIVSDLAQVGVSADGRRPVLSELTAPAGWAASTSPTAQIDHMTRTALAHGYTGLRMFTDVTDLVRGTDARAEWIRSEHLKDRYALGHPLTALCGYDVDDLSQDVVAEAACVHALVRGTASPFQLRASDTVGGLALVGEVDLTSADALRRALLLIGPEIPAHVAVDMSELDFIDHAGLLALEDAARSLGVTMTLVAADPVAAWLVGTLALRHVRAQEVP